MGTLEEDYSAALAPVSTRYTESRADEASLIAPITTGEYRLRTQQQESVLTTQLGAMELRLGARIHSEISQVFRHYSGPINSISSSA